MRFDRMLRGSRSGLIAPPAPGVPEMPPVPAPLVVAPPAGAVVAPAPSSTGAASCVSVVLQPTTSASTSAPIIKFRMGASSQWVVWGIDRSARQRSPGGLAHVGGGGHQTLLDPAIGGDCCQYAASALFG